MQKDQLLFGDVINSYRRRIPWWDIPGRGIQWHQRRKWDGNNYKSTHSVLYLGDGVFFEVTAPRARFGDISEFSDSYIYPVCRYRDVNMATIPEEEKQLIREVCVKYDGTRYDYGQLLDIGIKGILGWIPEHLSIFDLGRKRKVCSVVVAVAYVKWWKEFPHWEVPRPLGDQHVEVATPADFENHRSFEVIGRLEL